MKSFWNERYSGQDYAYGTKPNDFLIGAKQYIKEKCRILSLGEGEGRNAVYLATLGHDVTAVDQSEIGLQKASQLAASSNCTLTTITCDLQEIEFDANSYDCIISIFCHVPSVLRKELFRKVQTALRQDGLFIIESYSPEQLEHGTGGPKEVDWLVSVDELIASFADFEVLHSASLKRDVHEGQFHNGLSAVTQFIGKKSG